MRFAAYFTPSSDLSAFIRAGYHRQNQDIGGYTYGTNLQESPDAAGGFVKSFGEAGRLAANLWTQYVGFDKSNGAGCYLQSPTNCNTTSITSPLVQYANSHDWNPYREVGASAVYSLDFKTWATSMQLGADYRKLFGQDYSTTYNRPTTTDGASATINRTNFGQGKQQFLGGFAQFRMVPLDELQLTLSARYDYWTNTEGIALMSRYTNGVPGPQRGGDVPDSNKGAFDPTLAVRYTLTDEFDLRAAAYKSFRAPGLNNLYRSFSSATSITIANPLLYPETLTGGEIGADYRAPGREVNATVFLYDIKDLIASYRILNAANAPPQVIAICGPTLGQLPCDGQLQHQRAGRTLVRSRTRGTLGRHADDLVECRLHVHAQLLHVEQRGRSRSATSWVPFRPISSRAASPGRPHRCGATMLAFATRAACTWT